MIGLQIDSFRLKGTPLFDDAAFDFLPGISAIYGLNQANARTSGNGNGAGKSAFFSQLAEVLYEEPIVGQKQDVLKGGTRTLKSVIMGKKTVIARSNTKLDIKIDGKSKFRTKPKAKAWLKNKMPITVEEYNTYVHLDARIPHPLVMGTSTERKRFFTSFFGLDKMDVERKLFTAELAKLGKVRAAYAELVVEYRATKEKMLPAEKRAELLAIIVDSGTELEALHEKNKRLQAIAQLLAFEQSTSHQLKQLRKLLPEVSVEEFDQLIEDTKKNLKQDKADLEMAREWDQYQRDSAAYEKAVAALSDDAKKLVAKLGLRAAHTKCGAAGDARMRVTENAMAYASNVKAAKGVLGRDLPRRVEIPEGFDKKAVAARLEALEHQYEHARQFKTGACDTCGQSVVIKSPKELKQKMEAQRRKLEDYEAATEYAEALAEHRAAKKMLAESEPELDALRREEAKLMRYANLYDELHDLPRRPPAFEGRRLETGVKERMVEEDQEQLRLLQSLRPNLDTIIEVGKLTDRQRASGELAPRLQAKINAVHEAKSKAAARLEVNATVLETFKRLRTRLREMKKELADEPALKALVESYADKGMKRMAIKTISNRLMSEVNKYARFVFTEDYVFDFQWESSQLSMIVNRNVVKTVKTKSGKTKKVKRLLTSDVRKLSGAESKLFTIVLVMALLTFVPARKRCNVMILDEPSANFSAETTKAFMGLLPVLNQVIPSIIIITPKTDERYAGATEYTVIKAEGTSRIVPGHPSVHRKSKA